MGVGGGIQTLVKTLVQACPEGTLASPRRHEFLRSRRGLGEGLARLSNTPACELLSLLLSVYAGEPLKETIQYVCIQSPVPPLNKGLAPLTGSQPYRVISS